MNKKEALEIIKDLGNSSNMVKHGLAVGFAMRALYNYLLKKGKELEMTEDDWEVVGILHDADYEITNKSLEKHTEETTKKLQKRGTDRLIIDAVRGHCDKKERKTLMAKALYAVDELTGLIVACALVQPNKMLKSVKLESVLKKMKDKSFAAGVDRNQIRSCKEELGIPLNEFIKITLRSMQKESKNLGL